jgi:hypothetical protein
VIGSSYAYLEAFIEPSSKCFQECGFAAPRGSKQKSNPGRLDDSADIFEDLDLGLVMAEAQLGREQLGHLNEQVVGVSGIASTDREMRGEESWGREMRN